ncbi:hypothetical protein [Pseudomonas nitroreducens]|uniref:hypothetical protein n=1 Tax=Pseudomonas nitroreducens TaxID=46680 RepID=UPI0020A161A3|nr:hypothetical protein [Pseudomonas nitroreducens]MCP1625341.1 hypothetical protein [Pseudomonas nitroreducens]
MIRKDDLLFPSRYVSVWIRCSFLVFLFLGVIARLLAKYDENGVWGWGGFQILCLMNVAAFLFDMRLFIAGFGAFCEGDTGVQFVRMMIFSLSLFLYFTAFFIA